MRILRSVGIGVFITAILFVAMFAWLFTQSESPASISEGAREDVVGTASLVSSVETMSTGSVTFEIQYLILDFPEGDASKALHGERRHLEELDWTSYSPKYTSGGNLREFGAFTIEHDTVATFQPLSAFLEGDPASMPREDFNSIKREFAGRDDLVIVELYPRDP